MADTEPLRVLIVGVAATDLERLQRQVSRDPLLRIAGTVLLEAFDGTPGRADAVLMTPEASARTLGTRARHPTDQTETEALTGRERDVLAYVAEGHGNREIGALLGISEHTVKFHLASIYGKLGVGNRMEAVQHALRTGLLEI